MLSFFSGYWSSETWESQTRMQILNLRLCLYLINKVTKEIVVKPHSIILKSF